MLGMASVVRIAAAAAMRVFVFMAMNPMLELAAFRLRPLRSKCAGDFADGICSILRQMVLGSRNDNATMFERFVRLSQTIRSSGRNVSAPMRLPAQRRVHATTA